MAHKIALRSFSLLLKYFKSYNVYFSSRSVGFDTFSTFCWREKIFLIFYY